MCYKCNKSGHFIKKCPNLNKKIELENI
ncbi:MAG: hypothetical protein E6Q89_07575 [Bacteroidia bacterium]|nr:MAG: hypothetical protein E6Q89_07575 [Bacteroidia bacterium]